MNSLREWLNGKRDYASGVKLYDEMGDDLAMKLMFSEPESDFKKKKLIKALEAIWDGRKDANTGVYNKPQVNTPPTPAAPEIEKELAETKEDLKEVQNELDDTKDQLEDLEWEKENLEEENEDLQKKLRSIKSRNGWPVQMDETISALHAQWKQKFLTMVDLQSRLYEVANAGKTNKSKEREAGEMALQILDLRDQVIKFYAKRDHYLVTGKLPEEPSGEEKCLDPALWPLKYDNAMKYARTYRAELKKIDETDKKYLPKLQLVQKWEAEAEYYRKLLKKD